MILYSYSPERGDGASKLTAFLILASAAALLLLGELFSELKPLLQAGGFALALGGILVCSRFLLSGYTYCIELSDAAAPDLVIIEHRGKADRTVCRVSILGGKLYCKDLKRERGVRLYDHRPSPFRSPSVFFEIPERDGEGFIRFCPDEKMLSLMKELGCEVIE